MRTTLDPKQDVVFKLLFARASNKRLLIALLTAILEPASPIVDVEVLNPEVTKEWVEEKGTVLDILVRLLDGRLVNLEMQASAQGWRMSRGVYYCARVFASQLNRGQDYEDLNAVVGVFILDFRALPGERYHSKFELLELHNHQKLTDDLTIHVVELPKLPHQAPPTDGPPVLKWSRFLAARSDEELEEVAMSDPDLREAKAALEKLSQDPAARRLAEERERAAWNLRYSMTQERKEGREEGRVAGREEGRVAGREEALREAVEHL
ncbi:MAG TPA: Rpn family recombination-promoting nuclease/putative transposase, partial [Polyangiaceae bacterium]